MLKCLGNCHGCLGSIPCPCNCFSNPYQTVPQGWVGLVVRFGKYYKTLDPGLFKVMPFTERLLKVDMRMQIEAIPSQSIMTKDNVNIFIDSCVYWNVVNPFMATFTVVDVRKALMERTMTTLRMTLGSRTLQECIEHRDSLAQEIEDIISPIASNWGIKVESILLKDLNFSRDLLFSLSSAAKQKRIGESKLIAAQAEVNAAKLLREASDILNTSAAMQMRFLQTLVSMAESLNTKVIFMPSK